MYRPPPNSPGSTAYDYVTNIVQHSQVSTQVFSNIVSLFCHNDAKINMDLIQIFLLFQGTFVSLIFCFFNGEVRFYKLISCVHKCISLLDFPVNVNYFDSFSGAESSEKYIPIFTPLLWRKEKQSRLHVTHTGDIN